jgi:uncharacterized membrane protein
MLTTLIKLPSKPLALEPTLLRTQYRITSLDLLRGLVMIIMALDHVRDFTHREAMVDDPLNFATTTPFLFFTRWITHFCAPVFVFLAGTSGFLQSLRKSTKELSGFLVRRGLWLILLEVTLITFGITFDIHWSIFALQTIWAIGISMLFLGLAVWLPFNAIFALGLLLVLGHNSLDFYEKTHQGGYSFVYSLLHRQGFFPLWDGHGLLILYPFLSWTGLMLLGFCFGKIFTLYEGVQRRKVLTALGLGVILFFVLLRATNLYGDPSPWATQKNSLFTFLSFINTTKYPPSLLYMCMTIGPAILFLAWMDNIKTGLSNVITVYGRVPFFYYVLHFYLIHVVTMALSLFRGHSFAEGAKGVPNIPFRFVFPGEGLSLGLTYLVWICIVAALYPLCKWFSDYKQTHKQWWLSYL